MWQSLKLWNWAKAIRVLIGLSILGQGIAYHQTSSIIAGGIFTLFGLFTSGYCGSTACYTRENTETKPPNLDQIVEFEEIKKGA